jgi:hypothetical protein
MDAATLFTQYQAKLADLIRHQKYAHEVVMATDGKGMTPVKPLATMGTKGGALLCDHCGKPIILEGGAFNNVYADKAWEKRKDDKWVSYIKGGLVVEVVENGTLRIYHGYMGNNRDCCNVALTLRNEAESKHKTEVPKDTIPNLLKYLQQEYPTKTTSEQYQTINDVIKVMFGFDVGFGVNQPGE